MAEREREFRFTPEDFEWVRTQVGRETGIELGENKMDMVYSRLARRLRALGLPDFASYRAKLLNGGGEEMGHFVNALTTNLTAFFRESHHFDHLAGVLKAHRGGPIRIWSAGCSTGEEAYSIAMTAREALGERAAADRVRIEATDLDSNVVAHGAAGIYEQRRVAGLSRAQLKQHFLKGRGRMAGKVRVRPEVQRLVSFSQLNLLHDWPFDEPFDVVFCRNVIIYFSKATQRTLFERMAAAAQPGAWLYIGHSETLWKVSDRFENHGRTIYRLEG